MIETERLRLRIAAQNEMSQMIERELDPELKCAYQQMLQGCLDHPEQRVWYAIWIIETKDGTQLGDLSFKGPAVDGAVEIGYGILTQYRGRGYATEAVGATVKWALSQPGVTRIQAETAPDNKASQRVLEKCCFQPTGKIGEEGPRFERQKAGA